MDIDLGSLFHGYFKGLHLRERAGKIQNTRKLHGKPGEKANAHRSTRKMDKRQKHLHAYALAEDANAASYIDFSAKTCGLPVCASI